MDRPTSLETFQSASIPSSLIAGGLQGKCACGQHTIAGGECNACSERSESSLQRSAISHDFVNRNANNVPSIVHEVLRSSGQPLDVATRAFMAPRFGHDFSRVRVHSDAKAAESAEAVNALAYTVGRDVVFGAGQFVPEVGAGRRLLAHELAHVVQQQGGHDSLPPQRFAISSPGDQLEREASLAADAVMVEKPSPTLSPSASLMQRQPTGGAGGAAAGGVVGGAVGAPAASLADLKAIRTRFKNDGTAFDPDDCSTTRLATTGVGVGGVAQNGMEITYRLDGPLPAETEFDITRTVTDTEWERDAAGAWHRMFHTPAGTSDDRASTDECLTPVRRRVFVTDSPGFGGLDPRGMTVAPGHTVGAAATGFVIKLSFAEWVIARNRRLGIGWTVISDPTFTFWHSITSVALVGGNWALANTPSGQPNQIALGSTSTAGATP